MRIAAGLACPWPEAVGLVRGDDSKLPLISASQSQWFNARKLKAPNAAASGKVVIQAKRIPAMMFQ